MANRHADEDDIVNPHKPGIDCCRNCGRDVSRHSIMQLRVCAETLKQLPERERLEREVTGR